MNNLDENAFQVILGSSLGDGHISKKLEFSTGSKYKEYVLFKQEYLKHLCSDNWYGFIEDNAFNGIKTDNKHPYHKLYIPRSKETIEISNKTLKEKLELIDTLGLAIWFYDDCSLHKKKHFYNLNTQSFSKEEHIEILMPFFESIDLHPKLSVEIKKSGKIFYYLRFNKITGNVEKISSILSNYNIECYKYKILPN